MRFKALCLAAILATAHPAGAVLRNYGVHWTTISQFNTSSPSPNNYPPGKSGEDQAGRTQVGSIGIIDEPGGGSPVLKKLALVSDLATSVLTPGTSGFIFLSSHTEEGPRKGQNFTATGSTNTQIAWGTITGWTVTGGFWCHSAESFICTYARGKDLETTEPQLNSPFYDLGTWYFHHTGFTSIPWVHQKASPASMSVGNSAYWVRGRLRAGLVPAVPLLGVALLGASLLFAGVRLSRKG